LKEVSSVKRRKRLFKDRDGQSIIEFALVLPILLMVLFGITEFGRAIMVTNVLHTACREGARAGVVSPASDIDSVATSRANEVLQAAHLDLAKATITIQILPTDVKVSITYNFEVLSGGILDPFMGTIPLKGSTVMRYEG
jgi:Flp pilus assembly protein TadG